MGRRRNKIPLDKVDEMIEEVDAKCLINADPRIQNAGIGEFVYIKLPAFSMRMRAMQKLHFEQKKVKMFGDICLTEGTIISPNKTYKVQLTPEIKELLRISVLMGGGRIHQPERKPIVVISRKEEEEAKKNGDVERT